MSRRITIVMQDDVVEKLRTIQAKMIRNSPKSVSFSTVCDIVLNKGLKK